MVRRMDDVVAALADQHAAIDGLLAGLDDADWSRPSRCDGWTVGDVVLHLIQTDAMAIGSLAGRFDAVVAELGRGTRPVGDVDEGAAVLVEHHRGAPPAALLADWRGGSATLLRALAAADLHARVAWVTGPVAVRTLAATRLAEAWIHGDDIGLALDRPLPAGDRLRPVARLAWRTLPYAFARAGRPVPGPVAFELVGPSGEPWSFRPDGEGGEAPTVIRGDGVELCLVAARRVAPADTSLVAEGPDGAAVLDLVRTYA
jgi:uncharacterized protein (TIGR03084 family)